MLSLTDRSTIRAAVRDPTLDPNLRAILHLRYEQLGGIGGDFHVLQPGDTFADAEAAIGYPLVIDDVPTWEWTQRHPGAWTEIVLILSDDGPAQVLLVPDSEGVDPALIALCREHATEPPPYVHTDDQAGQPDRP